MSCKLLDVTIELLRNGRGDRSVFDISTETGLPYGWLNNLLYSKRRVDPSVGKVVKLYEYLSGKKLDV